MQKWEYLKDDARSSLLHDMLSKHGEDGWELVSISSYEYNEQTRYETFFKRPINSNVEVKLELKESVRADSVYDALYRGGIVSVTQ